MCRCNAVQMQVKLQVLVSVQVQSYLQGINLKPKEHHEDEAPRAGKLPSCEARVTWKSDFQSFWSILVPVQLGAGGGGGRQEVEGGMRGGREATLARRWSKEESWWVEGRDGED